MALSKRVMGGSTSVSVPALKSLVFAVSHRTREATRAAAFKRSKDSPRLCMLLYAALALKPQGSNKRKQLLLQAARSSCHSSLRRRGSARSWTSHFMHKLLRQDLLAHFGVLNRLGSLRVRLSSSRAATSTSPKARHPNSQSKAFSQTQKPPSRFTCTRSHPCSPCALSSQVGLLSLGFWGFWEKGVGTALLLWHLIPSRKLLEFAC